MIDRDSPQSPPLRVIYDESINSGTFPHTVRVDDQRSTRLLLQNGYPPAYLEHTAVTLKQGKHLRGAYFNGTVPITYFSGFKPGEEHKVIALEVPQKINKLSPLASRQKIQEDINTTFLTGISMAIQDAQRPLFRRDHLEEAVAFGIPMLGTVLLYDAVAGPYLRDKPLLYCGGLVVSTMGIVPGVVGYALDKMHITLGPVNRKALRFANQVQTQPNWEPLIRVTTR